MMQLLLPEVRGHACPEIVRDLVLLPAGMTHSTYEQPLAENLRPTAALGYKVDGSPVKDGWHSYPEMALAGLRTTRSDLALLAIEAQNEYAGKSNPILSPKMIGEALTIQSPNSGLGFAVEKLKSAGMSCGSVMVARMRVSKVTSKHMPARPRGIVILTNGQPGSNLISEICRAVSRKYNWPDFQPKEPTLARIVPALLSGDVGTSQVPGERALAVRLQHDGGTDDRLYLQANPLGPQPQELLAESDRHFFVRSEALEFTFNRDGKALSPT